MRWLIWVKTLLCSRSNCSHLNSASCRSNGKEEFISSNNVLDIDVTAYLESVGIDYTFLKT